MPQCERLSSCAFFNDKMPNSSGLGALYKRKFCLDQNATCARHLVLSRLGAAAVPVDLYPNMMERARQLLAES